MALVARPGHEEERARRQLLEPPLELVERYGGVGGQGQLTAVAGRP